MVKAMAPHSSTLAWKITRMEEPGRLQSMGLLRVRHGWATSLSCIGGGNGNPLHCYCLENPRDGRAWWAAIYGVTQSRTRLKQLSSSSSSMEIRTFAVTSHNFSLLKLWLGISRHCIKAPTLKTCSQHSQNSASSQFSSVLSLSHVWLLATPRTAVRQASLT